MTTPLHDGDRALVRETLQEIEAAPPPRDRGPLGCVIALPGFVLLLVFPLAGRIIGASATVASVVIGMGVVLLGIGVTLWFNAGRFVRGHAAAAAEAALRQLESDDDDREVQLRAATLLLANAYATYGAATSLSFDPQEARRRLGLREGLVLEVERVLLEDGLIDPVFTLEQGGGDDVTSRGDAID